MMTLSWLRFEWDLGKIPTEECEVLSPFILRGAESHERDAIQKVVTIAFSTDTGWSDIQKMFGGVIVRNVNAGFEAHPPHCILILHGSRVIAASILNPLESAESHLATGPCVLQEYRGRGLGTALLKASLAFLRETGLTRAYGVTRDKSTAARFVYPKFEGAGGRWMQDFEVAQKIAA